MSRPNLLVLCTGNSARSQMAEAFFRKQGSDLFNAYSAGTEPKGINPYTIEVMAEKGIDLSGQSSKNLTEYLGRVFMHTLIIVCHDADENARPSGRVFSNACSGPSKIPQHAPVHARSASPSFARFAIKLKQR